MYILYIHTYLFVVNYIYTYISYILNEIENHRTETAYEDALATKVFAFQFINCFVSLFYIAFVQPFIQDLDPCVGTCMELLKLNVAAIFLSRVLVQTVLKIIIPYFDQIYKKWVESRGADIGDFTEVENLYVLAPYDTIKDTFADYIEKVILVSAWLYMWYLSAFHHSTGEIVYDLFDMVLVSDQVCYYHHHHHHHQHHHHH
jgi:hypothetical protein